MGSTHFLVVWMEVWDGLGSTPGEYSSNMRVRLLRRNLADGAAPLGLRTPNLIPSPPQTLSLHLPSTRPLHQTAAAQRRAPHIRQGCAAPASPSAGLAIAPAPPGPPRPRSRPARLQVRPRSRPPAGLCPGPAPPSAPDRLRISARVAPPSASPRHLPRTGARSALCPGSLQVSTGLVLFCCYFFIAIS